MLDNVNNSSIKQLITNILIQAYEFNFICDGELMEIFFENQCKIIYFFYNIIYN